MITGLKYALVNGWEQCPPEYRHRSVSDVAVDSRDRIYLFTRDDNRVIVYERDGTFVTAWGDGRFRGRAHGIAVGPDDSVYCINDLDHTVRKFTPGGELLMTLGTAGVPSDTGYDKTRKTQYEKNASVTRAGPPFNRPTRIAFAANGDMYVADGYGNTRVHRFAADGTLLQSWGAPGTGPGQFQVPHGIAVAADGRVLVADRENDRIQIFTPDGEYLNEWGGLSRPTNVFIDRSGLAYVSETGWAFDPAAEPDDKMPLRVSVFDGDGNLVARWQSADDGALGPFAPPHGLCVDSRGDLYLASNNRRERATRAVGAVQVDYSLQKFARMPL
jgi:sugar lactone lactonase YvrE